MSCFRGAIQNRLRKENFMQKQDSYDYYVGIDCAQNKHDFAMKNNQDKFLIKKGHFSNTLQGYEKFLNTVLSKCLDKDKILFGMEVTGIYGTNLYERLKSDGYHVVMIFRIPLKITETTNDLIKQIKLILPVLPNFF